MNTILLTGSCGFIASNLTRKARYEKWPYRIVAIDKIANRLVINNIYEAKNHQFYIGDIADDHFVDLIFEMEKPDVVLHMAAESHVDLSLKDPYKFIHSNVLGTQVLVKASVKYGVKKFVMVSTDEIYGSLQNENDPLWAEDSPPNPRNPYSASKLSAEYIVRAAGNSFGLNYCITRSSNNYGPRQTPDKFIPKIIKCIINETKMPVYGQGLQMRDWLHVNDNCAALMKIVDAGKSGEIYNISANQEYRNIEVLHEVCKIMNKKTEDVIEWVADRPGHDFRYGIDSGKVRQLGWAPTVKFKQGLVDTVDWYMRNKFLIQ
jgi:dTDP-glucose 4,6-dehydratase